jgi:peptide/nickel transport system permease protein
MYRLTDSVRLGYQGGTVTQDAGNIALAPPALVRDLLPPQATRSQQVMRFVRRKPWGALGAVIVVVLLVTAALAPWVAPYGATETKTGPRLEAPSSGHLAGTDQFGRDIFSRIIHGSRISLFVGVGVVVASAIPAIIMGLLAAFYGGWIDYLLGRLVDTVQAIPQLILLIAIMVILGPSLINVIIALSVRRAITESRILRSAALSVNAQVYVEAARCLGAPNWWIMLRYLLPNIMPLLIVITSVGVSGAILAEASLSFLGYGVPPPAPSWGGMLASDGRTYMFAAPWMLWAPTIALSIVVFGTNMFGDALRDVLDPRLRGT